MAKRKRLSGTPGTHFAAEMPSLETKSIPPIAQISAEASEASALAEMSAEWARARAEGRLIQSLTLASVDKAYLMRDRMAVGEEEMETLMASLAARGQQTPIEVVETKPGRYGLISGWRRLTALERLGKTHVEALIRTPASASDAYVAMVEENEIRVGLSYYERARIAVTSVEQGIFDSRKSALQALFASASRAKRSKIGSFMALVLALDGHLRYPTAIPERMGLPLSKALEETPDLGARLRAALGETQVGSPEDEAQVILEAWKGTSPSKPKAADKPLGDEIRPGVFLEITGGFTKPVLTLSGPGVDPGFRNRLEDWLRGR